MNPDKHQSTEQESQVAETQETRRDIGDIVDKLTDEELLREFQAILLDPSEQDENEDTEQEGATFTNRPLLEPGEVMEGRIGGEGTLASFDKK